MTISVVIPAYNEEHFLQACLESLTRQTHPPDEIIVVDNNSTDATAEIAHRYKATVIAEARQGIFPAVYAGFTASKGDIIARCDADSVLPADWIETIAESFRKQPDIVAVTGPGRFYDAHPVVAAAAQVWYMYAYFVFVGAALANWPLFGSNCALRRDAWKAIRRDVHVSDPGLHDDIDISMHLRPGDRILFKPLLRVGISARALRISGLNVRYARGLRSLYIHWPKQAPWKRWYTRLSKDTLPKSTP